MVIAYAMILFANRPRPSPDLVRVKHKMWTTSFPSGHTLIFTSVVGFLWLSDDGELKPKQLFPVDSSGRVTLSKSLTEVVCRKRHAVWIDNQSVSHNTASLNHFADAMCVPLVHDSTTLGALHLYLERGRFAQGDFDISISLANMLVVALVRARQRAVLATKHHRLMAKSADLDELIGDSRPMERLKSKISRVAHATGCVLIRGESGRIIARMPDGALPVRIRAMRLFRLLKIISVGTRFGLDEFVLGHERLQPLRHAAVPVFR